MSGVATSGRAYAYDNPRYNNDYSGQHGGYANQAADMRFNCRVNTRGQVSDINISRNRVAYRGY